MAKVAIVTGASRGLGKGCASVLASEAGYTVYATGRTTADLEKLAAECAAAGKGKIIPCSLDQKDDDAVQAFVSKVKAEAGKVDLLVNSAYQGLEAQKPYFAKRFYERPIAEFDAHMNVGVRSSYVMASLVAPMTSTSSAAPRELSQSSAEAMRRSLTADSTMRDIDDIDESVYGGGSRVSTSPWVHRPGFSSERRTTRQRGFSGSPSGSSMRQKIVPLGCSAVSSQFGCSGPGSCAATTMRYEPSCS